MVKKSVVVYYDNTETNLLTKWVLKDELDIFTKLGGQKNTRW